MDNENNNPAPQNPLGAGNPFGNGTIDTAAISLHELYSSYVRAGFTDDQAFKITLLNLQLAYGIAGH